MRATIAVVDDDPGILQMMELILEEEGYRVIAWSEGVTAYEMLRRERPDALVLDLRMELPDSGLIVLEAIRKDALLGDLPVIVCSAEGPGLMRHSDRLENDGCAVLPKPFGPDELLGKIEQALERGASREVGR